MLNSGHIGPDNGGVLIGWYWSTFRGNGNNAGGTVSLALTATSTLCLCEEEAYKVSYMTRDGLAKGISATGVMPSLDQLAY